MDINRIIGSKSPEFLEEELTYLRERSQRLAELEKKQSDGEELEKAFQQFMSLASSDKFMNAMNTLQKEWTEHMKQQELVYANKLIALFEQFPEFKKFYNLFNKHQ